jgi:hypothetical protein
MGQGNDKGEMKGVHENVLPENIERPPEKTTRGNKNGLEVMRQIKQSNYQTIDVLIFCVFLKTIDNTEKN